MDTTRAEPQHLLTILAVSDLARSVAFYESVFGWPRRIDAPVLVEFALPAGCGLGVYQRDGFARNTGQAPSKIEAGSTTATELYLRVDDLEQIIRKLEAAGARQLSALAPRTWGDEAAYYADPDGNLVAVARPSPGGNAALGAL